MKSSKPKKAPKVAPPSREEPNYMREADVKLKRDSAQAPMTRKRLSK